jgi:hypothetical protein
MKEKIRNRFGAEAGSLYGYGSISDCSKIIHTAPCDSGSTKPM